MRTVAQRRTRLAGMALSLALAVTTAGTALPAVASSSSSDSTSASASSGSASASPSQNPRGPVPVYEPSGDQITGGSDLAGAVEVQPGVHWDSFENGENGNSGDGTQRFYRLPALQDGEQLYASAVLALDTQAEANPGNNAGLSIEIVNQQGDRCGSSTTDFISSGSTGGQPVVSSVSDPMDAEATYGCHEDGSGVMIVQVQRTGAWQADTAIPVELHFWVAPPVNENELNEAPSSEQAPQSVSISGQGTPVEPGSSFATAVEAPSGQIVSAEIRPYQVHYYKVPVEYGQRLNYRISQGNNEDASVRSIDSTLYTPLLDEAPTVNYGTTLLSSRPGEVVTQNASVPTSAENQGNDRYHSLRVAGDYYIVVSASNARANRAGSQPFRYDLAVDVTGEPGGTTDWAVLTSSEDSGNEGPENAGSGGEGATTEGDESGEDAQSSGPSWLPGGSQLAGLLGGLGVGAVLVGVIWLLMRRRNAQP